MTVKHPEVRVRFARRANDFSFLGDVIKALRAAGVQAEEIDQLCDQALAASEWS